MSLAQAEALLQPTARYVAAPSARCRQCSRYACSDWGHSRLCVADWCLTSSITARWRRGSECRCGSACTTSSVSARTGHAESQKATASFLQHATSACMAPRVKLKVAPECQCTVRHGGECALAANDAVTRAMPRGVFFGDRAGAPAQSSQGRGCSRRARGGRAAHAGGALCAPAAGRQSSAATTTLTLARVAPPGRQSSATTTLAWGDGGAATAALARLGRPRLLALLVGRPGAPHRPHIRRAGAARSARRARRAARRARGARGGAARRVGERGAERPRRPAAAARRRSRAGGRGRSRGGRARPGRRSGGRRRPREPSPRDR
mmetsp:Transcript_38325/g.105743  ORF Transcript_38325/g.105743 Transcript_38325/m.105743 type:complete len:322 (-) Transcript_38325:215-1180(-)